MYMGWYMHVRARGSRFFLFTLTRDDVIARMELLFSLARKMRKKRKYDAKLDSWTILGAGWGYCSFEVFFGGFQSPLGVWGPGREWGALTC